MCDERITGIQMRVRVRSFQHRGSQGRIVHRQLVDGFFIRVHSGQAQRQFLQHRLTPHIKVTVDEPPRLFASMRADR